ncbi:hypothetical protein [Phytoactinopolyspora halophila]|nr:hypothetical protein [Phytoactinopolyspora halophila]
MTTRQNTTDPPAVTAPGPSLVAPAVTFVASFVASLILGPILGAGAAPSPFSDADAARDYFADNPTVSQITGLVQFGAAIALGVFTAASLSRMRQLVPNTSAPAIGAVGGSLSAIFLAINGVLQWVLGQADITHDEALVQALHHLYFGAGGPAHVGTLGLLVAGIAWMAISAGALPRWLSVVGVVIASISVVSLITFLTSGAAPLVAIGRFTAMIWIVVTAVLVSRSRRTRTDG